MYKPAASYSVEAAGFYVDGGISYYQFVEIDRLADIWAKLAGISPKLAGISS
jgi:hypothetical protein